MPSTRIWETTNSTEQDHIDGMMTDDNGVDEARPKGCSDLEEESGKGVKQAKDTLASPPPSHCISFPLQYEDDDNIQDEQSPNTTRTETLDLASISALCFGMLVHSYLFISVFPYSGYMVMALVESANQDNAGSFAGLLASSFNFGRVLTAYSWGRAADVYGRKNVLIFSLALSSFFCILFGLAPTFGLAILLRFLMGMCNGIIGTNKTLVSDLSHGNEKLEAKVMSLVLGMWGWGFLVAPVISGLLAEPVKQYPNVDWETHKTTAAMLSKFPFLLPNLLGCVLCLLAIALCHFFIQEPLPKDQQKSPFEFVCCVRRVLKRAKQYRVLKEHPSDINAPADDSDVGDEQQTTSVKKEPQSAQNSQISMYALMSRPQTRSSLLVFWGNCLVSLAVDEMFPLFCISVTAGFGLEERKIGQILSAAGLIFAAAQYFVQPLIYNRYGLYGSIRVGALLCAPTTLLFPLSLLFNLSADEGHITAGAFAFLALILAANKSSFLAFFANISVATNRTVPMQQRAALNGLSVLGGSLFKALGPSFAGIIATVSVSIFRQFGSLLMFGSLGCVASLVALASFWYLVEEPETGEGGEEVSIVMVREEKNKECILSKGLDNT